MNTCISQQEPSASSSSGKQRIAHQSKLGGQGGTKVVDGKTVIATASKTQKRTAHTPNVVSNPSPSSSCCQMYCRCTELFNGDEIPPPSSSCCQIKCRCTELFNGD